MSKSVCPVVVKVCDEEVDRAVRCGSAVLATSVFREMATQEKVSLTEDEVELGRVEWGDGNFIEVIYPEEKGIGQENRPCKGWSNRETWAIGEVLDRHSDSIPGWLYRSLEVAKKKGVDENGVEVLGMSLRGYFVKQMGGDRVSVLGRLVMSAIDRVNWEEIIRKLAEE